MSKLDIAKTLAKRGLKIFPCQANAKRPLIKKWNAEATTDSQTLEDWFVDPHTGDDAKWNIAVACGPSDVVVIDVDTKNGGHESVEALEIIHGLEFPPTFKVQTPSGGWHLYYRAPKGKAVSNGVHVLGQGIDVRSKGGLVVAPGSSIDGKNYVVTDPSPIAEMPAWMLTKIRTRKKKTKAQPGDVAEGVDVDGDAVIDRVARYLRSSAPEAVAGRGGNSTTYRVACWVKDQGVSEGAAVDLLLDHYNDRCNPPWDPAEIIRIVHNAYQYGENAIGESAPQGDFDPVDPQDDEAEEEALHPIDAMSRDYALVMTGATHSILWETRDAGGHPEARLLAEQSFHRMLSAETITGGDGKPRSLTKLWINHPRRRTYHGLTFDPSGGDTKGYYNLWRGFTVLPGDPDSDRTQRYLEHLFENICAGDEDSYHWLLGWMAHMVQRPWEKPHVAVVLRGGKGTGKNKVIEPMLAMLGNHGVLTSNARYLSSNFNSHLERALLIAFDEAFWSGDKRIEGGLKDLITGSHHMIERKRLEPYRVPNLTRVCKLANEEWVVPASMDERRYFVLDVPQHARTKDTAFFAGIDRDLGLWQGHLKNVDGGLRDLLAYLRDFSLDGWSPQKAPATTGLMKQKELSFDPFDRWWADCLEEGRIVCLVSMGTEWPDRVDTQDMRRALLRYCDETHIRSWSLSSRQMGWRMKALDMVRMKNGAGYYYSIPPLDKARARWRDYLLGR